MKSTITIDLRLVLRCFASPYYICIAFIKHYCVHAVVESYFSKQWRGNANICLLNFRQISHFNSNLTVFGLFRFKMSDKWQLPHHPQRNFPPLIVQCGNENSSKWEIIYNLTGRSWAQNTVICQLGAADTNNWFAIRKPCTEKNHDIFR